MRLKITAEDLENGAQGSRSSCPLALALKRVLKPDWHPYVGSSATNLFQSVSAALVLYPDTHARQAGYVTVPHNPEMRAFVKAFDFNKGSFLGPTELELEVELPAEVLA